MSSTRNVHSFDGLPPEILYDIFDYLDLDTLKSVSLACSRLERIFSSYCCIRFMLFIVDNGCVHLPKHPERVLVNFSSMESVAKTLQHSTRYYRKVHLPVHLKRLKLEQSMNSVLNKILKTDWLHQLVILILAMGKRSQQYTTEISAAVSKMDHLQELQFIQTMHTPDAEHLKKLKIENSSLQRLVLEAALPTVINCPKLRQLDVAAQLDAETHFGKQYAQYGEQEPYWKLKQLEEFTIKHQTLFSDSSCMEHRPGYKLMFYQHLIKLKKLHIYETPVSEKFLQSVCESCVHLEDLFLCSLQAIDPNSLCCLSNLTNLRRLGIWDSTSPRTVSFAFVKLPKLEHLTLGMMHVVWESLKRFQSIKSLSIRANRLTTLSNPRYFARCMKQLEFLWIDFGGIAHKIEMLESLQELPRLKILILEKLNISDYLPLIPPLPQLNRLILYKFTHRRKDVTVDVQQFPKLKRIELELPKCFKSEYEEALYRNSQSQRYEFLA